MDANTCTNEIKILPKYRVLEANKKVTTKKSNKRKTTDQYKAELYEVNKNIEVIDEYAGNKIKIRHRCLICEHIWLLSPSNALKSRGCPECKKKRLREFKTLTQEEYEKQVFNTNKNIKVIGKYINSHTNIEHKCLICHHIWDAKPTNILSGVGCPKCKVIKLSSSFKKSHEQYVKDLKMINPNVIPLEEYINARTPILHKFLSCGHVNKVRPYNILNGSTCLQCKNKKLGQDKIKTQEQFENEVFVINNSLKIIGEYVGANKPIQTKCLMCGHMWCPIAYSLINKSHPNGCPRCAGSIVTSYDFYERFNKYGNKNIVLTSEYVNSHTKIDGYCKICGYVIHMFPYQLTSGVGCKICMAKINGSKLKKTQEQFISEVKNINPNIEIIGEYSGANEPVKCRCLLCSYVWKPIAHSILSNKIYGCPSCSASKLETITQKYLDQNNIVYNHIYKYQDLRGINGGLLSYDFYLPEYNILIECQGEQHERPIEYFGGKRKFFIQQIHDLRKRKYAKLHGIRLITIWYNQINDIEKILDNYLNNLKLESVETTGVA